MEESGSETDADQQNSPARRGGQTTARLDLAPECAGLVAASLGYPQIYKEGLLRLDAAMALYDAYYRGCRDATGKTHNWPKPQIGSLK